MVRHKPLFSLAAFFFLAASLALATGCGSSSPNQTVDSFFAALAAEDLDKAKTFLTGTALATHPAKGSQASRVVFAMGKAYKGVAKMEVKGDKAEGVINLDGSKVAESMLAASKSVLEGIKDPKVKMELTAQMKKGLAAIAASYSRVPARLIRKDSGWLISDLR